MTKWNGMDDLKIQNEARVYKITACVAVLVELVVWYVYHGWKWGDTPI